MFKEVPAKPDFPAQERAILKFWDEQQIFQKLQEKNKGNDHYSFIDGPITANNPMGVHHAWGRTYKDVFQRHRAMHGYDQRFQNGFDCQGLWVEVEVEKALDLNSKKEIIAYGLDNFARACRERVDKYAGIQTEQSRRLGQWMDWDNSYFTMDDNNIEHIWHFLKVCQEKGLLYRGSSVMPWCLRCGTSLSQHELADSYRDMTHPSVFIALPIKEREGEFFAVWTTTPWTLPANVALAVNPDLTYVQLELEDGRKLWVAEEAQDRIDGAHKILEKVMGKKFLGWNYQGPFAELPVQAGIEHKVISWEEVSGEEGTGIVHIAPGCGAEDYALSQEFDLDIIAPIDEAGNYYQDFDFLTGENAVEVAQPILDNLRGKGYLFKVEEYHHRYPVCWRCSEELVFRLEQEWFIRGEPMREPMLANAAKVNWQPQYAGKLMADWLNNMGDWCISRKRFWGLPLPFYSCSCGEVTIISSREELEEKSTTPVQDLPELHRPWIDQYRIECPRCGQEVERIEEVGDCWLDAGIVPFSTLGYLNGEEGRQYWEKWFPAHFVVEMREQIRLWFYAQLFMSSVLEDTPPYKRVMTYEKVHDENGRAMHKSWGNAIWFDDAVEEMGADIMRYIYTSRNPNINLNFGYSIGEEIKRRLLTFWNTYSFFVTYARLDGWKPQKDPHRVPLTAEDAGDSPSQLLDRWLVARVQETTAAMDQDLWNYDTMRGVRHLDRLIEDTSRWYVRRNRRRFWKGEEDADKDQAYHVLYYTLLSITRLMAPLLPFISEEVYQNLVCNVLPEQPPSIHLCPFPEAEEQWKDEELLEDMDRIMRVCSVAHSARNQEGLKVRQPLRLLEIAGEEAMDRAVKRGLDIIKDEVNIKEIDVLADQSGFYEFRLQPNFSRVGARFGPLVPAIKEALEKMEGDQAVKKLDNDGKLTLEIKGEQVELEAEDINIQKKAPADKAVIEEEGVLVALDTEITPELLREGMARDILRHIQTLRKEGGLEVETRIKLTYRAEGLPARVMEEYADYIKSEALADSLQECKEITMNVKTEINLEQGHIEIGLEPQE